MIEVGNHIILHERTTLIVTNVAGFECLLVKDATDGYVGQERKAIVVDMITLSQVFGTIHIHHLHPNLHLGFVWLCVRLSICRCCPSAPRCRDSNEET